MQKIELMAGSQYPRPRGLGIQWCENYCEVFIMYAKICRVCLVCKIKNGKLPKDYKNPIQMAGNVKKSEMIKESGVDMWPRN